MLRINSLEISLTARILVPFNSSRGSAPMNSPIKATDTGSVVSPDHNYRCLRVELAEQVVCVFRTMVPHATVPEEFYEHVVRKLDEQATRDEGFSGFLSNGVEVLSRQAGSAWTALSAEAPGTGYSGV